MIQGSFENSSFECKLNSSQENKENLKNEDFICKKRINLSQQKKLGKRYFKF